MKYAHPVKKPVPQDWHPADVKASLEKKGYSLARLGKLHVYTRGGAQIALRRPWPRMEKILGAAIGVPPQTIWPSRYHADGTHKSRGGYTRKHSTAPTGGNVQELGCA